MDNSDQDPAKKAIYNPREFRGRARFRTNRPSRSATATKIDGTAFHNTSSPNEPSSEWHWSVKILALGWVAFLVVMAIRYLGR